MGERDLQSARVARGISALALPALTVVAIACGSSTVDPFPASGGHDGAGGSGGTEASTSAAGATDGTGGGSATCGDGVADEGEQCDGNDFAGKTCETIGFAGGNLVCSLACQLVPVGCESKEACNDGTDNDNDGYVDCEDSDCAGTAACLDGCTAPVLVSALEMGKSASFVGHGDAVQTSCGGTGGADVVLQVAAAPQAGTLAVLVQSDDDVSVSARTSCSDAGSELACANAVGAAATEQMNIPLEQGQTVFLVVDAEGPTGMGEFTVTLMFQ